MQSSSPRAWTQCEGASLGSVWKGRPKKGRPGAHERVSFWQLDSHTLHRCVGSMTKSLKPPENKAGNSEGHQEAEGWSSVGGQHSAKRYKTEISLCRSCSYTQIWLYWVRVQRKIARSALSWGVLGLLTLPHSSSELHMLRKGLTSPPCHAMHLQGPAHIWQLVANPNTNTPAQGADLGYSLCLHGQRGSLAHQEHEHDILRIAPYIFQSASTLS